MADVTGWTKLGAALGGDSELEYQKGLALGAQTQNALAEARKRVDENEARARLATTLKATGLPASQADAAADTLMAGGNLADALGLQLKNQELRFRATAGNPETSPEAANVALRGVAPGPVEQYYNVGAHDYASKYAPGIQPLGDSLAGGGSSAALQALTAFNLLGPDGKILPGKERLAFEVLRNTNRVTDVGGVPYATGFNPYAAPPAVPAAPGAAPAARPTATAAPTMAPLATPAVAATNAAQIAHAKKVGEVSGERAAAMPSTLNTIDQFSSDVTNLLQQPGFDAIYGHIAGTNVGQAALQLSSQDAANAIAARDQVQAEAFQVAIQKMRGLGQLSNQEGLKVQNAFTRAVSHRISSPEARKAWMETLTHLDTLKKVARQEGGPNWASVLDNGAPAAPSVPTFATEAEAAAAGLPSGTRVIIGGQSGTWQ